MSGLRGSSNVALRIGIFRPSTLIGSGNCLTGSGARMKYSVTRYAPGGPKASAEGFALPTGSLRSREVNVRRVSSTNSAGMTSGIKKPVHAESKNESRAITCLCFQIANRAD